MLRKQIRLEKWVSVKDGSGDFKESVTKYNLWADVSKQGGGRSTINGKTNLTDLVSFKVRFRPDFKPTGNWRVVYNGKRYTVRDIQQDGEDRFFWIIKADSND